MNIKKNLMLCFMLCMAVCPQRSEAGVSTVLRGGRWCFLTAAVASGVLAISGEVARRLYIRAYLKIKSE